jgi:hypothetical protein
LAKICLISVRNIKKLLLRDIMLSPYHKAGRRGKAKRADRKEKKAASSKNPEGLPARGRRADGATAQGFAR